MDASTSIPWFWLEDRYHARWWRSPSFRERRLQRCGSRSTRSNRTPALHEQVAGRDSQQISMHFGTNVVKESSGKLKVGRCCPHVFPTIC